MKNKIFFTFFLIAVFAGTTNFSAQNNTNSSEEIKILNDKKRAFNEEYGFGYRIQIYYGNETKARSIEKKFKISFPEVATNLNYDEPYWKTQVGNYKTKLEADRALLKFSKEFSGLIVVPLGK